MLRATVGLGDGTTTATASTPPRYDTQNTISALRVQHFIGFLGGKINRNRSKRPHLAGIEISLGVATYQAPNRHCPIRDSF